MVILAIRNGKWLNKGQLREMFQLNISLFSFSIPTILFKLDDFCYCSVARGPDL